MSETKIALKVALRSTGTAIGVLFLIGIIATLSKPYHEHIGKNSELLIAFVFLLILFWLFYRTSRRTIKDFKETNGE
jgi:uncharacterized membrane protein YobD (UPF0266 family)